MTVVIPAYRAERTIERTVESVLLQQGEPPEVIVVIDGDLDRTEERLQGFGDRITVLLNVENRGAQRSRNRGLAVAAGEFVMFLDADDLLEGPVLAGLRERMTEVGADLGFAPMSRLLEVRGIRQAPFVPNFETSEDVLTSWLVKGRFVAPCSILWRSSFLRSIGGWDESVERNQDGELVVRAILGGAKFVTSTKGCGLYVQHDSADRTTRRPENLPDLMRVADKFLRLPSGVVSEDAKVRLVAAHFYNIAACYQSFGMDDLAREALARSRALGFRGHGGPLYHRLLCSLLGLRLRYRLTHSIKRFRGRS
ncbi:glycosyltransferase family 2 protein [Sphingosinicella sp. CPCC 101087]|uniref:glycosyltransferase family 2 protein n=1 Tax=Sphingosinicella sp. CPCC 101087 TaxID=2497754 RepID=UPI0013EB2E6B|nr:glycosyltransferase family 2 protein [Sphingosinicella sp. CPCC 101087]